MTSRNWGRLTPDVVRDVLKDGPPSNVIQGLTQSAESDQEANKDLKERYGHPRLTHYTHVCSILQALPLKANNGRELRKLYNHCNQHTRAIKASDNYNINMFSPS